MTSVTRWWHDAAVPPDVPTLPAPAPASALAPGAARASAAGPTRGQDVPRLPVGPAADGVEPDVRPADGSFVRHAGSVGDVRDIRSAASVRRRAPQVRDEIVLDAAPAAPRTARRWVMQVAAAAGIGGAANQVAELLTGELVANTVVHGPAGAPVVVRATVTDGVLRVDVEDCGGGTPRLRRTEPTAPNGRGLALVDALASGWGTTHETGRTTVWFEVDDF